MKNIQFTRQKKQPHFSKKTLWSLGAVAMVLCLVAALALPILKRGNQAGSEYQIAEVIKGAITETVDSYGVLEAEPSIVLTWPTAGVVEEFDLKIGDKVFKDDVLMELEIASQSTEVLNAYTSLLEAEMELELLTNADVKFQEVLGDLVYQEKMLINKRADKLAWNYGRSPEARLDAVRANYYAARVEVWDLEEAYNQTKSLEKDDPQRVAAYEALQAGILKRDSLLRALNQILGIPFDIPVETDFIEYDQQVATVAEARVAYNRYVDQSEEIRATQAAVQVLQNKIDEARIIAPFDGTVTAINVVDGDVVSSGEDALRIDNLENLLVQVNVTQAEVNKVQIGQSATLTFDALTRQEYSGFVHSISHSGSEDANGVVQFSVEIRLEDADEDVKTRLHGGGQHCGEPG